VSDSVWSHADIIAAADAEARSQGFDLVAIHAFPHLGNAVTLCYAHGPQPWAVHRFSAWCGGLNQGGYHSTRGGALAEFRERESAALLQSAKMPA
jgi:hypothetical protein